MYTVYPSIVNLFDDALVILDLSFAGTATYTVSKYDFVFDIFDTLFDSQHADSAEKSEAMNCIYILY